MRRTDPVPPQDIGCANNRLNYKTMSDFERFLKGQVQTYIDGIDGYTGAQIEQLKNSRTANDTVQYNTALSNLQLAENILSSNIQCLNKDILQRNEYASRMYTLQQEIEDIRKEVQAKKTILQESKERASQVETPYATTTWWETWFPLGRPIQKENVPVLIGTSIAMLLFSLAIFLRFAGIDLRFTGVSEGVSIFKGILGRANTRNYT